MQKSDVTVTTKYSTLLPRYYYSSIICSYLMNVHLIFEICIFNRAFSICFINPDVNDGL